MWQDNSNNSLFPKSYLKMTNKLIMNHGDKIKLLFLLCPRSHCQLLFVELWVFSLWGRRTTSLLTVISHVLLCVLISVHWWRLRSPLCYWLSLISIVWCLKNSFISWKYKAVKNSSKLLFLVLCTNSFIHLLFFWMLKVFIKIICQLFWASVGKRIMSSRLNQTCFSTIVWNIIKVKVIKREGTSDFHGADIKHKNKTCPFWSIVLAQLPEGKVGIVFVCKPQIWKCLLTGLKPNYFTYNLTRAE